MTYFVGECLINDVAAEVSIHFSASLCILLSHLLNEVQQQLVFVLGEKSFPLYLRAATARGIYKFRRTTR